MRMAKFGIMLGVFKYLILAITRNVVLK